MVATMPSRLIAPSTVRIFQSPSGVDSCTLRPPRALPKRRVICVETPLSSRKTKRFGPVVRIRPTKACRRCRFSSVSRPVAWSDFFYAGSPVLRRSSRGAACSHADRSQPPTELVTHIGTYPVGPPTADGPAPDPPASSPPSDAADAPPSRSACARWRSSRPMPH